MEVQVLSPAILILAIRVLAIQILAIQILAILILAIQAMARIHTLHHHNSINQLEVLLRIHLQPNRLNRLRIKTLMFLRLAVPLPPITIINRAQVKPLHRTTVNMKHIFF